MVSLSYLKTIKAAPTTTVNTSGTGYAVATLVANLEATTATLGGSDIISTDNTKTLTNKTIVVGSKYDFRFNIISLC